jgi:antitoxin component YwqK of YwqJK toxin-antitoxin module
LEREYHPDGSLAAERAFARDAPTGVWRTWFSDGTPRSELDFGPPGSSEARLGRFWHANGELAAEGLTVAGVREGRWSYWSEDGRLLRSGIHRGGKRDGLWSFYDEHGGKRAEGLYALGQRVGDWTLWDERGEARTRPASDLETEIR